MAGTIFTDIGRIQVIDECSPSFTLYYWLIPEGTCIPDDFNATFSRGYPDWQWSVDDSVII